MKVNMVSQIFLVRSVYFGKHIKSKQTPLNRFILLFKGFLVRTVPFTLELSNDQKYPVSIEQSWYLHQIQDSFQEPTLIQYGFFECL